MSEAPRRDFPFGRLLVIVLMLMLVLVGCQSIRSWQLARAENACVVTEPEWLTPPEDSAVDSAPAPGYYYSNADSSILAGAWWWENEDYPLQAGDKGTKVGWFRPEGIDLIITGERIAGQAQPLQSEIPCCYPTRFQASGLYFPTEGCWEVSAAAADSQLTFTVWVEPAP